MAKKMHYKQSVIIIIVSLLLLSSCEKAPAPVADEASKRVVEQLATLSATATVKQIMMTVIDPNADFLWGSTQEIADSLGVRKKEPKTDADWAAVRYSLLLLRDAPALLVAPGRKAALLSDRSSNPAVENQPEVIQALMDTQRPEWTKRAEALRSVAMAGLVAADARDVVAFNKALTDLDHACESCHVHFWYPNDLRARQVAREEGVTE